MVEDKKKSIFGIWLSSLAFGFLAPKDALNNSFSYLLSFVLSD
jgi:hypothetical protein